MPKTQQNTQKSVLSGEATKPNFGSVLLQQLAVMALLVAMDIVLSRLLAIQTPVVKISLNFIPTVIAARYFGIGQAMIVAGMGDLLGALIFPMGTFFPGFTLSAVLVGLCYGVFLNGKISLPKIILSIVLNQVIVSTIINSFWLYIYFEMPLVPTILSRTVQCIILIVIESVVLIPLLKKGDVAFRRIPVFKSNIKTA